MMAMLKALVTEEGLSGPDLDVFLAESRDAARRQASSRRLVLRVVRSECLMLLTANAIHAGRPSEDLVRGPTMPSTSMCARRCQLRTASRVAGP